MLDDQYFFHGSDRNLSQLEYSNLYQVLEMIWTEFKAYLPLSLNTEVRNFTSVPPMFLHGVTTSFLDLF